MGVIKSFEDVEAWKSARELSKNIYDLTLEGSFSKDYGLKDQINRASGSIMDNIAEGFERGGNKEFVQFLSYARGSAGEVRSQLYRAFDRKHMDEKVFLTLKERVIEVSKMLTGFMMYLRNSDMKGLKFHEPYEVYLNSAQQNNFEP